LVTDDTAHLTDWAKDSLVRHKQTLFELHPSFVRRVLPFWVLGGERFSKSHVGISERCWTSLTKASLSRSSTSPVCIFANRFEYATVEQLLCLGLVECVHRV